MLLQRVQLPEIGRQLLFGIVGVAGGGRLLAARDTAVVHRQSWQRSGAAQQRRHRALALLPSEFPSVRVPPAFLLVRPSHLALHRPATLTRTTLPAGRRTRAFLSAIFSSRLADPIFRVARGSRFARTRAARFPRSSIRFPRIGEFARRLGRFHVSRGSAARVHDDQIRVIFRPVSARGKIAPLLVSSADQLVDHLGRDRSLFDLRFPPCFRSPRFLNLPGVVGIDARPLSIGRPLVRVIPLRQTFRPLDPRVESDSRFPADVTILISNGGERFALASFVGRRVSPLNFADHPSRLILLVGDLSCLLVADDARILGRGARSTGDRRLGYSIAADPQIPAGGSHYPAFSSLFFFFPFASSSPSFSPFSSSILRLLRRLFHFLLSSGISIRFSDENGRLNLDDGVKRC